MEEMFQINGTDLVIKVPRELDHHCAKRMNMGADRIIERKNIRRLIYDFRMTEFMDSSGVGLVMGRYRIVRDYGGNVRVCNLSDSAYKVMQLSGLSKLMQISRRGGDKDETD